MGNNKEGCEEEYFVLPFYRRIRCLRSTLFPEFPKQ